MGLGNSPLAGAVAVDRPKSNNIISSPALPKTMPKFDSPSGKARIALRTHWVSQKAGHTRRSKVSILATSPCSRFLPR